MCYSEFIGLCNCSNAIKRCRMRREEECVSLHLTLPQYGCQNPLHPAAGTPPASKHSTGNNINVLPALLPSNTILTSLKTRQREEFCSSRRPCICRGSLPGSVSRSPVCRAPIGCRSTASCQGGLLLAVSPAAPALRGRHLC